MRQFTILRRRPHGAVFVKLPDYFEVKLSIVNDMAILKFTNGKNNEIIFISFFFIDEDEHRKFDNFSKKGQALLLERLSEVIVADISSFVSGDYEDGKELELPYHSMGGCFDMDAYIENWLGYYDLISDDDDILVEYSDPEEETDE